MDNVFENKSRNSNFIKCWLKKKQEVNEYVVKSIFHSSVSLFFLLDIQTFLFFYYFYTLIEKIDNVH